MNKSEMLRFVNLPLSFSFLVQGLTGAIIFLEIRLPVKDLILDIHAYNGLLLAVLSLAHVYLNWGWIRATFFPAKKKAVDPS